MNMKQEVKAEISKHPSFNDEFLINILNIESNEILAVFNLRLSSTDLFEISENTLSSLEDIKQSAIDIFQSFVKFRM